MELKQPTIFIHSNAIDRAVLVYLNYRSAYQTWKDEIDTQRQAATQRASQSQRNTVLAAPSAASARTAIAPSPNAALSLTPSTGTSSSSNSDQTVIGVSLQKSDTPSYASGDHGRILGGGAKPAKLFLKVTVSDFKIKMPLTSTAQQESGQALVLMIKSIGVAGTLGDITGFKEKF